MKKILCILLSVLMLFFLFSCKIGEEENKNRETQSGSLYVNGTFITDTITIVDNDYAIIPFIPVLKALGFSVEWTDENTATVSKDSKSYTFSLADKTLIENNRSHDSNLIITAPGCDHGYVQAVEKDLIMNHENVASTLQLMGITVRRGLDRDNMAVCIDVIKEI